MSRTIEQKVVEMRFDNSNFEKNVSQSMDSLNKLQTAIDKTSSGNAFAGLSKALDNVNFGSVTTAIQTVTEKFSVWEQVAIGAARNVGAALSNYVISGLNNMVFSNISAGWDKYAQKTEAVQTIMASLADQDFGNVDKMEYVSGVLEKLNWFTDETSFHFTDMVSSIGKFTSAGVDLEKASDAMMGIATWAAVSGANADTASRVMYQLSQSLGMGSVRTQDWMSVETANMATKEFKELAIQVAKAKGEITSSGVAKNGGKKAAVVTFQNFRETLKDGWLTSEVLTDTLGEYSSAVEILNRAYSALDENVPTSRILPVLEKAYKEAEKSGKTLEDVFSDLVEREWGEELKESLDFSILDENGKIIGNLGDKVSELGLRAFRAAQEAKTFAEAMGSVGDAASTIWMNIWEKVFGDYETAKILWTDLANYLYDIFVSPLWDVYDIVSEFVDLGGRDILFGRDTAEDVEEATGAFYIMLETVKNVESAFMEAFGEVFPFGGKNLVRIATKMQEFAKRTRVTKDNVEELTNKIKNFFQYFKDIIKSIDIFNTRTEDGVDKMNLFKSAFENTFGYAELLFGRLKKIIDLVKDAIVGFFDNIKLNWKSTGYLENAMEHLGEIGNQLYWALDPVIKILEKVVGFAKKVGKAISGLITSSSGILEKITSIIRNTKLFERVADGLNNILDKIKSGFESAFDSKIFDDIKKGFYDAFDGIKVFIDGFRLNEGAYSKIEAISKGVASAINLVGRAINFALKFVNKLIDSDIFTEAGKFLSGTVINALLSIPAAIGKIITKIDEFIGTHPEIEKAIDGIATIFSSIIKFVFEGANAISEFIRDSKPLTKVGEWIKGVFDKFSESEKGINFGEKITNGFKNVVEFFRDDFYFENFKNKIKEIKANVEDFIKKSELLTNVKTWFDGITDSVKKFIDESEFLSNFKTNLKELWENIKKLFGGEENFEGFGANFMSGFVKGLVDNVGTVIKALKDIGSKMLQALKDFFGIHSPSTETEEIGSNLVDGLIKGLVDGIKRIVEAVKRVAGSTLSSLTSSLFGGDDSDGMGEVSEQVKEKSKASENIKTGLGNFAKNLLGIGAIALPTAAIVAIPKTFSSLMSPFAALRSAAEAFEWKMKGEVIVNAILAIGDSLKKVLLAIGGLVLMVAAAAAIMAFAKKYTTGQNGEDNLTAPMWGLVGIIGEILSLVGTMAVLLGKVGGKSSTNVGGASLSEGITNFEQNMNQTAEWIRAIGDIFVQLGEAMLMMSGAIAILAAASKYFGKETLEDVMLYFGVFSATMLTIGFLVAKWSDGATSTKGGLNWKTGINFEHNGWSESLYAIGTFMLSIGTAMAAMALAAAIVIKASNGDTKMVETAFQGMMGIVGVIMGILAAIVYIQENSTSLNAGANSKSSSAIKEVAVIIAAMAGSIRVIAKTVIMLGKEDPNALKQGLHYVMWIGAIVLAFGVVASLGSSNTMSNAKGLSGLLLGLAASFAIIAIVIKQLGKMDAAQLDRGLKAFATFAMFFGVLSAISLLASSVNTDSTKFGLMGFMLMEVAASLVIVAAAIKMLDSVENMGKAILGLVVAFAALGLLFGEIALISKSNKVKPDMMKTMATSMVIISAAFAVMGVAFKSFGEVANMGSMIAGAITAFAALGLLFALVAGMTVLNEGQGSEILKSAAGLALVAASMAVLLKIISEVGTTFSQNEGALGKGVLALAAVLGVLAAVAVIANFAGPAMLTFGMGIAALGIGMLALAAGMFVFYQVLVLLSAEAALFGGAVSDMIESFLDRFIGLGPKIADSISMIFKAIANGIADSAIEIVKAIIKVLKTIGDSIDEILAILGPIIDKITPFIIEKISLLIELVKPLVEGLVTHLVYLVEEILLPSILRCAQSIIDFLTLNVPVIADMLVTTVENVVTRLLTLIDYLVNSESGILNIIRKALLGENGVLTIVEEFLHALLEALRNLSTDLIDTIIYLMEEVVRGMLDGIDILLTGVEDAIKLVAEHIVSLTDTILQSVVDVLDGIAKSIEDHGADIFGAIGRVVSALINAFGEFLFGGPDDPNSLLHLGKEIMNGIGKGLTNFVGDVVDTVTEVAGKIVDGFKKFFGIKSPSRLMMTLGGYLDKGLAKGIDDESSSPIKSITGLGGGIVDTLKSTFLGDEASGITGLFGDNLAGGLNDALGGISDVLDTDDFTPTITPVLDLSEIQNGASQIPGMINSGSGYTVDTTAVVRSAYSPYEHYDGTERVSMSDAQLSYFEALKSKMDEMVNKFANAKVVLDTGAVVGGIVDPMDLALGQRMAQVGRGVISSSR